MTINRLLVGLGALVAGIVVAGPGESQVCPPSPGTCRTAAASVFTFKNRAGEANDRLVWRWIQGEGTTPEEFLDPTTTVTTALCLYAGTGAALIGEATLPPGPLWHVGDPLGADGMKIWYKDPAATTFGVRYVLLRSGGTGEARITVKTRGAGTPQIETPFPMDQLPLVVQIHQDDGPPCWGSTFTARKVNHGAKFKAKSP